MRQLAPKTPKRQLDMAGAFVAGAGDLGETLVDGGEAKVQVGDEALRSALLLGDSGAEAIQCRACSGKPIAEQLGRIHPGPAHPRLALGD